MKNKKAFTLTLIGLFIFLFGVIGITYAYWQLTLTQTEENLVYTDCLKITTSLGTGSFTLNNAYPMSNNELINDFFPSQAPYHFTIENRCDNEVPLSINMESLSDSELKDEYVDVILWEGASTEKMKQGTTSVLSHEDMDGESRYQLTKNTENKDKIITDAKAAYQLYSFKLPGKTDDDSTDNIKEFNLLLFMDYATPVSTPEDITNNVTWKGKITLNNYESKSTLIETIQALPIQEDNSENSGIYAVNHTNANITWNGTYIQKLNLRNTEYRYAGPNYKDDSTDYVHNYVNIDNQVWRIIGLVNTPEGQRVKLVKDEKIGYYSWDTSTSNVNSSWGVNEWSDSDLMKLLNPEYDTNKSENSNGVTQDTLVNNSLYWNGGEGRCYDNNGNYTDSCIFDNNNKMPESLKSMIEEITWNTGSNDGVTYTTYKIKVNEFYNLERSSDTGKICDSGDGCTDSVGRKTSWKGKVGLIYPSDYGYATSGGTINTRTDCFETNLGNWSDYNECRNNDWLYSNSEYWTLSPFAESGYADFVFNVSDSGNVRTNGANNPLGVRPSVYLKENVLVTRGDGSKKSPYVLSTQ